MFHDFMYICNMEKLNIFLDDIRTPEMSHNSNKGLGASVKWIIVRDYFDFVKIIDDNFDKIGIISFDHDLACFKNDKEYTGKDAVNYLINYCLTNNKLFPNWYTHTDNITGRYNMIGIIKNYLEKIEGFDLSDFRYYHRGIVNNKYV